MLTNSSTDAFQPNLFGNDLSQQLDPVDPLLHLAAVIPWQEFEHAFQKHYIKDLSDHCKLIGLMVGLLLLKQLEDLSDEDVVVKWKRNPYYQSFCDMSEYQSKIPCHATKLSQFRKLIGPQGVERLFQMSVSPCMEEQHWKITSTSIRPYRKTASPTRRMRSSRSRSSTG